MAGFASIPNEVLNGPTRDLHVYIEFARAAAGTNGYNGLQKHHSQVTIRTIAERLRWPRSTVHEAVLALKASGQLIEQSTNGRRTKQPVYFLPGLGVSEKARTDSGQSSDNDSDTLYNTHPVTHPIPTSSTKEKSSDIDGLFSRFWEVYPKRAGGNPRKPARKAFESRMNDGVDPEVMISAAGKYAAFCEATDRVGTEFIKQAQFWLGPSYEGWVQNWKVPEDRSGQMAFPEQFDYPND